MAITKDIIRKNYETIQDKNTGAEFVKVDLHVHTPASGDARAKNKYAFKVDEKSDKADIPRILKSAEHLGERRKNLQSSSESQEVEEAFARRRSRIQRWIQEEAVAEPGPTIHREIHPGNVSS